MAPLRFWDDGLVLCTCLAMLVAVRAMDSTNQTEPTEYEHEDIFYGMQNVEYTKTESYLVSYLPKPFALLSLMCSYTMAREVVVDHRARLGGPIPRMIFSRSIYDGLFSLGYFIGNWAVPADSFHSNPGQIGTQGTCTFQGIILQFGFVGSVLANTALSFYYLWVVRYGWSDRDVEKWEKWMQGFIHLVAVASAIYPIPLEMYNPVGHGCFIGSDPPMCSGDDCIRGHDPTIHYFIYAFMPIICLMMSVWIMIRLFMKVREIENKSKKYATSSLVAHPPSGCCSVNPMGSNDNMGMGSAVSDDGAESDDGMDASDDGMPASDDGMVGRPDRPNGDSSGAIQAGHKHTKECIASRSNPKVKVSRRKSVAVAKQGAYYVIAFLMTHFFSLLFLILYEGWGIHNNVFDILVFSILTPSAGSFDFIVFARTREMKTCEGKALRTFFFCGRKVNTMGKSTKRSSASQMRRSANKPRLSGDNNMGNDNPQPQQQLPAPPRTVAFQDEQDMESAEASFMS